MSMPTPVSPAASPPESPAASPPRRRLARLLRPPRRTVRLRLTLIYGGVFLLSGGVLLALTYLLVGQTSSGPNYSAGITAKGAIVKGPRGNNVTLQTVLPATARAAPKAASRVLLATEGKAGGRHVFLRGPHARGGAPAKGSSQPNATVKGLEAAFATNGAGAAGLGGASATNGAGPAGLEFPGGGLLTVDQARAQAREAELLTLDQARAQARKLEALGRQQHAEEMHRLLVDLGIALAIVAILSLGLGWLLAGRLLRPLQTITKAARAISAKSLHRRLALRGPSDELREVGDTFDELLGRLERSFEAQRQFVANASHELRTPLTLERAIVEVTLADPSASNETLRSTCERVLAIGEQQERTIDALLALARSERGLEVCEPFDLSRLAREVIAARNPQIASSGLRLESDLPEACASGDPSLAERLVANLIDNAVLYNLSDGWVSVRTATTNGRAVLTVSNSGPVVPAQDVERLFHPFQRIGASRASQGDGHGLGLSIVSAIAAAHDADLQARARPEGGLQISVGFDATASPSELDDAVGASRWDAASSASVI
jgi:signal transduction histidine kinase